MRERFEWVDVPTLGARSAPVVDPTSAVKGSCITPLRHHMARRDMAAQIVADGYLRHGRARSVPRLGRLRVCGQWDHAWGERAHLEAAPQLWPTGRTVGSAAPLTLERRSNVSVRKGSACKKVVKTKGKKLRVFWKVEMQI